MFLCDATFFLPSLSRPPKSRGMSTDSSTGGGVGEPRNLDKLRSRLKKAMKKASSESGAAMAESNGSGDGSTGGCGGPLP